MTSISYHLVITHSGTDYTIQPQELGRFRVGKSITNKIGGGMMYLVDPYRDYYATFQPYDEWKLYVDGAYAVGGHINRIKRLKGELALRLVGYTDMLKWARCQEDTFTDVTGSAMLNTASTGLIKKYFEDDGDRKTIYSANYVDSSGQESFSMEFDNETVFEAIKKIAANARRTSGVVPYDFYVDYVDATSQIEMIFNVKNNTASGISLYEGQDFYTTYDINWGDLDQLYNSIVVRGALKQYCPNDNDYWTNLADPETDGVWTDINGDAFAESTIKVVGTRSVGFTPDAGETTTSFDLNLNDADAYDSDTMASNMFSSGNGFIIDTSIQQYLEYWVYIDSDAEDMIENRGFEFYLLIRDESSVNIGRAGWFKDGEVIPDEYDNHWGKVLVDLTAIIEDESYVGELHFAFKRESGSDTTDGDENIYIDGIRFINEKEIETSATEDATSISAYGKRSLIYTDRNLDTLAKAETVRNNLLKVYKDPMVDVTLPMMRSIPIVGTNAIELGETFTLNSNEINANTYRLNEVIYTPGSQILKAQLSSRYTDISHDSMQFSQDMQSKIREAQRR